MKNVEAVVLAAGKGVRMKSDLPKILLPFLGRPMIERLLDTLRSIGIEKITIVIGYQADLVREALAHYKDSLTFALQEEQLGTGHAVMVTENNFIGFTGNILVLAGDAPCLAKETIEKLLLIHEKEAAAATVLSSIPDDPAGYGRIIRIPGTDIVEKIVEHKDANEQQLKINEINSGTFCFDSRHLFSSLKEINANNKQGEYYLTDVVGILRKNGLKTAVCLADNANETLGINSIEQLADLEARFE